MQCKREKLPLNTYYSWLIYNPDITTIILMPQTIDCAVTSTIYVYRVAIN